MTTLGLLLRLSLTQRRRDFSWRTFFVGAYFAVVALAATAAVYLSVYDEVAPRLAELHAERFAALGAVSVALADLLLKLMWRRSPVEMDDALRSRPVAQRDWALFILADTALGGLQWLLPLAVAGLGALVLPPGHALLLLLTTYSVSMVNALFQNCWRRAPGNRYTLPLVFGYVAWTVAANVAALAAVALGVAGEGPWGVALPAAAGQWVVLLLNVAVCRALHAYFGLLRNHNEEMHAVESPSARSLGEVSVWSIEWVQVVRSKRLRTGVLAVGGIFLLNTYLQQTSSMREDLGLSVNPMLLLGIVFPSIIMAQWVLGIEANYFGAVHTKPWPVEGILRRKYAFFCLLCCLMALLILPCVVWLGMSVWSWLAALAFGCGAFVLPFMATCLYSSRMDLFASAFFNYQGSNRQLNVFSFLMFVQMGVYFGAYVLLPVWAAHVAVGGLGLAGLALHRWYIRRIAAVWHRRRYEIMERWLTE